MLRRAMLLLLLVGLTLSVLPAAAEATTARPQGQISSSVQNTFTHRLTVSGWAEDPAKPTAAALVRVWIDGTYVGHAIADAPSPLTDKTHKLTGNHHFSVTFAWTRTAAKVVARTPGVSTTGPSDAMGTRTVTHVYPAVATRIIAIAKPFVGKARYVEGGASPKPGFDCSGYTMYVFAQAKAASLPHNAEAQRHVKAMHTVSAAQARAGDLVFYLSGGQAYHVAIYAGHHMQYAAATPADGIRYQAVWSSDVQYRTLN